MSNNYAEWAPYYIQKGISVIPDIYGSKRPQIKGWTEYCKILPTPEEVKQWSSIGDTNIAVACGKASGIIALDMDCEDTEIIELLEKYMPHSPVERIGSKGWLRFFRYNGEPTEAIKRNGKVVLEILSTGKKATIPPSKHPAGMLYKWSGVDLLEIDINELPFLPPVFTTNIKHILQCNVPSSDFDGKKIINGRFDALQSECGKLIREKLPLDDALKSLIKFDEEEHEQPYFKDHMEHYHTEPFSNALKMYSECLNSFNKKHMEKSEEYEIPITKSTIDQIHLEEVVKKKALQAENQEKERESFNMILEKKDGVLYDIQKFILANSFIKQPMFALSAALGLVGTLIGRKASFSGNASNLYLLNVAPSGAGKDAPQQCIKKLFIDLNLEGYLGSGDYVSDASLMDTLPHSPVRLDIIDEASGLLKSVNKGANTFDGKMADILCEIFTSSSSKFLGRMLANGTIRGQVDRPCVSLLMSTTPRGFEESLSIKAVEKGLLGRTLIFKGGADNEAERIRKFTDIGENAKTQLREIAAYEAPVSADSVIGNITQKVKLLDADKEANIRLDEIFLELDNKRIGQDEDSLQLPVIARMFQLLCKLAMIRSVSRNLKFVVNKDDVEFGYKLVMNNLLNFGGMVEDNMHSNTEDEYISKVMKYLERNGAKNWKSIRNSVRSASLPTSKRKSTIDMMVKSDMLAVEYSGDELTYFIKESK